MTEPTITTPCASCGHIYAAHLDSMNPEVRASLAIEDQAGCGHGDCGCQAFVLPQTTAPDPPSAPEHGACRLAQATERQVEVVVMLARAVGHTVMLNWGEFPTRLTEGLSKPQMGCAGMTRALAQLLASALAHMPDDDPRLMDAIETHVDLFRDHFAQARQDFKDMQAQAESEKRAPVPTVVMVPPPKLLM